MLRVSLRNCNEVFPTRLPSCPSGTGLHLALGAARKLADALQEGVTAVLLAPPTAGPVCGQAVLLKTIPDPGHPLILHQKPLSPSSPGLQRLSGEKTVYG